jgi:hypothetical protein
MKRVTTDGGKFGHELSVADTKVLARAATVANEIGFIHRGTPEGEHVETMGADLLTLSLGGLPAATEEPVDKPPY